MKIRDFQLERYFARYEFSAKYLLSPSDCESRSVGELLEIGGKDARARFDSLWLGYTESRGHPDLLSMLDAEYGTGTEGLLCGCPEELIFLFMNAFLTPGDGVVCVAPAYQSLYELPRAIGCPLSLWNLKAEKGRWLPDMGELERLLQKQGTRLLVLNFPHNPTGWMPSEQEFETIVSLAEKYGVTIFSDEMYRGLEDEAVALPTLAKTPNAVALGGASKSLGLPGLRMGWLASQNHGIVGSVLSMKDYTTICNSAPGEFLAILALKNKSVLLERNREILRRNSALCDRFFKRHQDVFEWIAPVGGPTAFPLLLRGNVAEMSRRAVEERSLMILPGTVFDTEENRFRIGMGRENFPQTLEVFEDFLKSWI